MIYEVKLKEAMAGGLPGVDQGGRDREPVDRHGQAGQRREGPRLRVDDDVKLMSRPAGRQGSRRARRPPPLARAGPRAKLPPPAALSPEAAEQFEKLHRPLEARHATNDTVHTSTRVELTAAATSELNVGGPTSAPVLVPGAASPRPRLVQPPDSGHQGELPR